MTSGRGAPLQLPSDEPWWGSGAPWTGSWWSSAATCSLRSWSSGSEASRWNQGAQFLHEEPGEETQARYTASKAPRQLDCLQPKATCLLPPPRLTGQCKNHVPWLRREKNPPTAKTLSCTTEQSGWGYDFWINNYSWSLLCFFLKPHCWQKM